MHAFLTLPATRMLGAVIALFLAGLTAAALVGLAARLVNGDRISRGWEALAKGLDRLDRRAGRITARLIDRPSPAARWGLLTLITAGICGLGAYAPPPLALAVLLAGLVWSFMVYRLWSSDEQDRARGFSGADKRIALKHDLFHEIWFTGLGVVAIFALIFFQINVLAQGGALVIPARYGPYGGYFAFVAAELQRLTPEVRELDLVHGQFAEDIQPVPWLGSGATLVFRILGELLIISAIFKLWEIVSRIRKGEDLRRQDEKLARGDHRSADEAIAELYQFAVRRDRAQAMEKLLQIANPAPDQVPLSPHARFEACGALERMIPGKPASGRLILMGLIEAKRRLAGELDPDADPALWGQAQTSLAEALLRLGEILGDQAGLNALAEGEAAATRALTVRRPDAAPLDWADSQSTLGVLLMRLGERLAGPEGLIRLQRARLAFDQALSVRTRADHPKAWAQTTVNLALVLRGLGDRAPAESGLAAYVEARALYAALFAAEAEFDDPDQLGMARNNCATNDLALALRLEGDASVEALRAAETQLLAALKLRPRDRRPADWAMSQVNLGYVYSALSERLAGEDGLDALGRAETALKAALEVQTEAAMPIPWASASNNLGIVHLRLGQRLGGEAGLAALTQAQAVFESALRVRRQATMPILWAQTTHNLATTKFVMAERVAPEARAGLLRSAQADLQPVFEVLTPQTDLAAWIMARNLSTSLLGALGEAAPADEAAQALSEAVAGLRQTLAALDPATTPREWRQTRLNLGVALDSLGSRLAEPAAAAEALSASVDEYAALLSVITPAEDPQTWANVQNNLGISLLHLAAKRQGAAAAETLRAAAAALQSALTIWTPAHFALNHERALNNLQAVQAALAALEPSAPDLTP